MAQSSQILRESGLDNGASVEDSVVPAAKVQPVDRLFRFVPALETLRHYSLRGFGRDLLAGLTVASVAVPQAMAYATIAGLPPQYGLYTAIVMTAVGALLDPSRLLINGPTNAISIALLSALTNVLPSDMPGDAEAVRAVRVQAAILLAFLVGLVQTGITLLRLGDLSRFISNAVIVGFTLGAAILLFLDQIQHLLGLRGRGHPGDHFLVRLWRTMTGPEPVQLWAVAVGLGTILCVLFLHWLSRRFRFHSPALLLSLVLMGLCVWLGGLEQRGVRLVEDIPSGLPAFALPDFDWPMIRNLSASSLAIALLGLLEAIAMAKAITAKTRQKLDINQQCLSEGLANLSGSFFQCFPGSGSLTRSSINQQAGAVSQWAGIISALAVAGTVLLFAPLARYIPQPALAGILVVSAFRLVDRSLLHYHLRATRFDAGIVLATALAAVLVSIEFCILVGVFLSFLLYVPRAAHVHLTEFTLTKERVLRERLPGDPTCDRILVFSLEGELFFGSAPDLEEHLEKISARARGGDQRSGDQRSGDQRSGDQRGGVRFIVLRLKRVRNTDAVCLQIFERFLQEMENRQVTVLMCGVRRDLAKVFRTSGLDKRLGRHRLFHEVLGASSTLDAVRQAYELLGSDLCPTCPRRGDAGSEKEVLYYMI